MSIHRLAGSTGSGRSDWSVPQLKLGCAGRFGTVPTGEEVPASERPSNPTVRKPTARTDVMKKTEEGPVPKYVREPQVTPVTKMPQKANSEEAGEFLALPVRSARWRPNAINHLSTLEGIPGPV